MIERDYYGLVARTIVEFFWPGVSWLAVARWVFPCGVSTRIVEENGSHGVRG